MPLTRQGPGCLTTLPVFQSESALCSGGGPDSFLLAVGTSVSIKSTDGGANWSTTVPGISALDWAGLCWASDRKEFYATALTGFPNNAASSPDGKTWTIRSAAALASDFGAVCRGAGVYVGVCGTSGGSAVGGYSADGITWNASVLPASRRWCDVIYHAPSGNFVACNFGPAGLNTAATSSDGGQTWTARTTPGTAAGGIMCITDTGRIIMPNTNGGQNCYSDDGGVTWSLVTISGVSLYSSAANGAFVSVLFPGTAAGPFRSTDSGVSFGASTILPVNSAFEAMCYAPVARRFVAVAIGGVATQRACYSTDNGATYIAGTTPTGLVLRRVVEGGS